MATAEDEGRFGVVTVRVVLVGFPDLSRRLGGGRLEASLERGTLGELVTWLQTTHAGPAGTTLGRDGRVDPSVQVLRNGRWVPGDRPEIPLVEGDEVTFLVLVAGG